jgi:hypothetical protein
MALVARLGAAVRAGELDEDLAVDVPAHVAEQHVSRCGVCQRNHNRFDDLCRALRRGPVVVAAGWFEDCPWSVPTAPFAVSDSAAVWEREHRNRPRPR